MGKLNNWLANRKIKKQLKTLHKTQQLEVDNAMKRVYNPMYFNVRPRYKEKIKPDEIISIYDAVNNIYTRKKANDELMHINDSKAET